MSERTRYLNIRFISPVQLQEKDAWFIVSSEVRRIFGIDGASEIGLFLSYFDYSNQGGIFRTSHKYVHRVRTCLCFIHSRYDSPLFLYSENLSGSLKKAKIQLTSSKHVTRYQNLQKLLKNSWDHHFDDD